MRMLAVEEGVIPANEVSLLTVRREMTVPEGGGARSSLLNSIICQLPARKRSIEVKTN